MKTKPKAATLKTGLRRILKLAARVEKVKRERFDFSQFVGQNWKGDPGLSCGTSACAIGWGTTMPLFQRLGLRLKKTHEFSIHAQPEIELSSRKTLSDFHEVCAFLFGIPNMAASALFLPGVYYNFDDSYPTLKGDATPKQWASHARQMVKILKNDS